MKCQRSPETAEFGEFRTTAIADVICLLGEESGNLLSSQLIEIVRFISHFAAMRLPSSSLKRFSAFGSCVRRTLCAYRRRPAISKINRQRLVEEILEEILLQERSEVFWFRRRIRFEWARFEREKRSHFHERKLFSLASKTWKEPKCRKQTKFNTNAD